MDSQNEIAIDAENFLGDFGLEGYALLIKILSTECPSSSEELIMNDTDENHEMTMLSLDIFQKAEKFNVPVAIYRRALFVLLSERLRKG